MPERRAAEAPAYPRLLAALANRRATPAEKGTVLFSDGEPYRGAVFLLEGTVTLRKTSARGRALILSIERGPTLFAEAPLLTGEGSYAVTAVAADPSRVVRLPPAELEVLLREPGVGREIVENLARKLHRFRATIFGLTLEDARERLHRFLDTLARSAGASALPAVVTLPVTKHELAQVMGITPETLSRTLEALETDGVARRRPGREILLLRHAPTDGDA